MELQAELRTALERLPNSSCPAYVGGDRANLLRRLSCPTGVRRSIPGHEILQTFL